MRSLRVIIAILLVLVGLVWIGQGLGAIPGSAMTGQSIWAVIGTVLVLAGAWLGWSGIRASRKSGSVSTGAGSSGAGVAG